MATENIGCADVSARYALQPTKSVKKTHPVLKEWWLQKIRQKSLMLPDPVLVGGGGGDQWGFTDGPSASAAMSGVSSADLFFAMYRQQRELHELATAHADLPVPTTLSGLKNTQNMS